MLVISVEHVNTDNMFDYYVWQRTMNIICVRADKSSRCCNFLASAYEAEEVIIEEVVVPQVKENANGRAEIRVVVPSLTSSASQVQGQEGKLQTCAPGGVPCLQYLPNFCCGKCVLFGFMFFCV